MNDERNHDLVELGKRSKNPAHKSFFVHRFYERTFGITKASISTKLQSLFNSETFYNLTVGESTIDVEEVLNSKKLVIFNLSKGELGSDTSEAFGRFLIAMIQSAILKRAQIPKHKRIPVHLFVDEFQNYIAPSLEEILSESRKYGLHLTLAQQYLGQRMDTAFKRGILSNTQVKVTGMASTDSRSAIAKEIGVDESDISRLAVGQFYIKVAERPAFKLYAPRFLLGNKNAMTWEDWHGVRLHQLNKYYRVLGQTKTGSDNVDKRGSDMSEYIDQPKTDETPKNKPKRVPKKPKFTFD